MASNFVLKINGKVDASQIQKDLSKMTPTITVQTVMKGGGTKAVTTYSDAVNNTVKVTKEFNSQNQLVAEGISRVSVNAENVRYTQFTAKRTGAIAKLTTPGQKVTAVEAGYKVYLDAVS